MTRLFLFLAALLLGLSACGTAHNQTEPHMIYLVEIDAYDPAAATAMTLRGCTGKGFTTSPSDTPANVRYLPRVTQPGSMNSTVFSSGTTGGAADISYGEIVFTNSDGALDDWLRYAFAGRKFRVLLGDEEAAYPSGFAVVMSGVIEQPTATLKEISFRIRDPRALLAVPIQANRYAGDNVLPDGLEGVDDLKGKVKPLLFGKVFNATPELVNTAKLIYQCNDGALQDIPKVRDKGVQLLRGPDYTDVSEMFANAPAAGTYRALLGWGCFRLGSQPVGQITFDGIEGATAADRTVAQVAKRIVLKVLQPEQLLAQSFADLDALNPAEVGIYLNGDTNADAALTEVLDSAGGWYDFDSESRLSVGRLDAPGDLPDITVTANQVLDIQTDTTKDVGRGIPAWKVSLDYLKNYTVQGDGDISGNAFNDAAFRSAWIPSVLPVAATWSNVRYGAGVFVAISGSRFARSTDGGVTWTGTVVTTSGWTSLAYGAGLFVAISYNSSGIYTSPDGINWTLRPAVLPAVGFDRIAFSDGVFLAWDSGTDTIARSTDGINWVLLPSPGVNISTAIYGGGVYLVTANAVAASVQYSTDGATWSPKAMPSASAWSASYGNGMFVATGVATSAVSLDGTYWVATPMPTNPGTVAWTSLRYSDGLFIAVDDIDAIGIYSIDGMNWIQTPLGYLGGAYRIAYGDGHLVVVPFAPANTTSLYRVLEAQGSWKGWAAKEYRTVDSSDATVQTSYPLAPTLSFQTLLVDEASAETEAARRRSLYGVPRDVLTIRCKLRASDAIPTKGSTARIVYPRFGLPAGKNFRIIGIEPDLRRNIYNLTVWG